MPTSIRKTPSSRLESKGEAELRKGAKMQCTSSASTWSLSPSTSYHYQNQRLLTSRKPPFVSLSPFFQLPSPGLPISISLRVRVRAFDKTENENKKKSEEVEVEEEEEEVPWIQEKALDLVEFSGSVTQAIPGPRVGQTSLPWFLAVPLAYLGITFVLSFIKVLKKMNSPRQRRRNLVPIFPFSSF